MIIKQITYTNTGNGWGNDRIIGKFSDKEIHTFNSISEQNETNETMYALDVTDQGYILSRSVPSGTDSHGRARFYIHGYVFSCDDGDEVFENYSALLGITEFASGEQDEMHSQDKLSAKFNDKLVFDDLHTVVECIYEALADKKRVEIYTDEDDKEYFVKKLMNAVYGYLPLSLRKLVSFGSRVGNAMRTVAITDSFSSLSGIKYNFSSGEVSGLSGKYSKFCDAVFDKKGEEYLKKLEKRIRETYVSGMDNDGVIAASINRIIFEDEMSRPVDSGEAVGKLVDVLANNQYNNPFDVGVMCDMLDIICAGKINTARALDLKLVEVFKKTNSDKLKGKIANHIVEKYTQKCDKSTFEAILSYEAIDRELYIMVTKTAIINEAEGFLRFCAQRVVEQPEYALFIKEICTLKYEKNIAVEIVAIVSESDKKDEAFQLIIKNPFHSEVIKAMTSDENNGSIVWQYLNVVYSDKEYYRLYMELEKTLLKRCMLFLCREAGNHMPEALRLFDVIYTVLGHEPYTTIEKELVKNKNKEILEKFYINILSKKAHSVEMFELQRDRMMALGLSVDEYVKATADEYSALCLLIEGKDMEYKLQRIALYTGGKDRYDTPAVLRMKSDFWKCFDWTEFEFCDEIRTMSADDKQSRIANALMDVFDFISGKASSVNHSSVEICMEALCKPNSIVSLKERDSILKKLRKNMQRTPCTDVELFLMLNYSNRKKRVNFRKCTFTPDALYDFFVSCKEGKSPALSIDGVFDSLYKFAQKKYKCEEEAQVNEYQKLVSELQAYKDSGSIQRATEYKLYLYIFVEIVFAALLTSVMFVNKAWFKLATEAVLVVAGIIIVYRGLIDKRFSGKFWIFDVIFALYVVLLVIIMNLI